MVEQAAETRLRRRDRISEARRRGRHSASDQPAGFSSGFRALGGLAYNGARVSAGVIDLDTRQPLVSIDERTSLPTGGLGRILLLIEASARMTADEGAGGGVLSKSVRDLVGDSGLWQHLLARSFTIADLAALVAATGDNMATNALLGEIGLDALHERAEQLGLKATALLDRVRERRGPDDAPHLSVGSAAELAELLLALTRGEAVDPLTSSRVLGWLSLNSDLSLVASAFGLSPLAHRGADHGLQLINVTGADAGVRAEAGVLRGPRRGVAYAATVQFSDVGLASRLRVLEALRVFGLDVLDYVH